MIPPILNNGKVGGPLPALSVLRILFQYNIFDVSSVSSSLIQFSQEGVCRKVVVKHSINPNALHGITQYDTYGY